MLFSLAEFHAFAKMRLHTERTLELFDQSVIKLGEDMRKFETVVCAAYETKELPRETAARGRRKAAAAAKASSKTAPPGGRKGKGKASPLAAAARNAPQKPGANPRQAKFELSTFKYHSFGDYPDAVRAFGTLDVLSSQHVRG